MNDPECKLEILEITSSTPLLRLLLNNAPEETWMECLKFKNETIAPELNSFWYHYIYSTGYGDTALPQKSPLISDRNLAKANCTENRIFTSCDTVVLDQNIILKYNRLSFLWFMRNHNVTNANEVANYFIKGQQSNFPPIYSFEGKVFWRSWRGLQVWKKMLKFQFQWINGRVHRESEKNRRSNLMIWLTYLRCSNGYLTQCRPIF